MLLTVLLLYLPVEVLWVDGTEGVCGRNGLAECMRWKLAILCCQVTGTSVTFCQLLALDNFTLLSLAKYFSFRAAELQWMCPVGLFVLTCISMLVPVFSWWEF